MFLSLTDHKSIFLIIIAPPFFINNNKMVYVIWYLQHLCFHYDIKGTLSNELDTLNLYCNNLLKEIDKQQYLIHYHFDSVTCLYLTKPVIQQECQIFLMVFSKFLKRQGQCGLLLNQH